MLRIFFALVVLGYVPGAVLFRLPIADRATRASLTAEERAYWAVMISVMVSTTLALVLAWLGVYTVERLLVCNIALSALLAIASLGDLRFTSPAPRPGWSALIPIGLIALGISMYFAVPAAEYIVGGRDPGVYMNEGIQIAQRRSLVTIDPVAKEVEAGERDLFFPPYNQPGYYSIRYMGFFLTDPQAGSVVGQFPHGYPIWIAIGYGLDGLSGTRRVVSWWALLGVLAVYFAGVQLVGRLPAAAAAALLAVHIIQTWHARYPNSEIMTQALLFAGLHAHARAHAEEDRYFGPVSASLLGLAIFVRLPAILAAGVAGVASLLVPAAGQRLRLGFILPLALWTTVAGVYYTTLLAPYFSRPMVFVQFLTPTHLAIVAAGLVGVAGLLAGIRAPRVAAVIRTAFPRLVTAVFVVAAVYAYFFREPGGMLAPQDAYALRTFANFYLMPAGLALAVAGYALIVWTSFWKSPALLLTVTTFAFFFFFKLRIYPEQFWTTRRFLDVILPSALLFISSAALLPFSGVFPRMWRSNRSILIARAVLGLAIIGLLGRHYAAAAEPLRRHVEYADLIPKIERLAGRIGDKDLVIIEARTASDLHALALPLSYIYARNVLVLASPRPDKTEFATFLASARRRYENVYFMGAGGTDLLGAGVAVEVVASDRFLAPEYETTAHNVYPRTSLMKPFAFTIYRFVDAQPAIEPFNADIGGTDDLGVVQFHVKERLGDGPVTFRWTQDLSYFFIPHVKATDRELVLRLSNGGRPPHLPPARVIVYLENRELGIAQPTDRFQDYSFRVPADLSAELAHRKTAAEVRLHSSTWIPRDVLGGSDRRILGVMMDHAQLR
jgi:hypothetical protein